MIEWISVTEKLPPVDKDDDFNLQHGYSKKVIAWVESEFGAESRFATYITKDDFSFWNIDGVLGSNHEVTHYSEINSPLSF